MAESLTERQRDAPHGQVVAKPRKRKTRAQTISERETGLTPEELEQQQAQLKAEFYARRLSLS